MKLLRSEQPFSRRHALRTTGWLSASGTSAFGSFLGFNIDDHWRNMGNGLEIFSKDPIRKVWEVGFGWNVAEESEYFVNKGAIMAEIEIEPGTIVKAYTTHLPSVHMVDKRNLAEKARHRAARLAAAQIFAKFIEATSGPEDNRIVGGDFNVDTFDYKDGGFTKEWSAEYALMTRRLGLVDGFHRIHGFEPKALTDERANPYEANNTDPDKYIDWLLHSGRLFAAIPLQADIVFKEPVSAEEVRIYGLPTQPPAIADHWGSKVILRTTP